MAALTWVISEACLTIVCAIDCDACVGHNQSELAVRCASFVVNNWCHTIIRASDVCIIAVDCVSCVGVCRPLSIKCVVWSCCDGRCACHFGWEVFVSKPAVKCVAHSAHRSKSAVSWHVRNLFCCHTVCCDDTVWLSCIKSAAVGVECDSVALCCVMSIEVKISACAFHDLIIRDRRAGFAQRPTSENVACLAWIVERESFGFDCVSCWVFFCHNAAVEMVGDGILNHRPICRDCDVAVSVCSDCQNAVVDCRQVSAVFSVGPTYRPAREVIARASRSGQVNRGFFWRCLISWSRVADQVRVVNIRNVVNSSQEHQSYSFSADVLVIESQINACEGVFIVWSTFVKFVIYTYISEITHISIAVLNNQIGYADFRTIIDWFLPVKRCHFVVLILNNNMHRACSDCVPNAFRSTSVPVEHWVNIKQILVSRVIIIYHSWAVGFDNKGSWARSWEAGVGLELISVSARSHFGVGCALKIESVDSDFFKILISERFVSVEVFKRVSAWVNADFFLPELDSVRRVASRRPVSENSSTWRNNVHIIASHFFATYALCEPTIKVIPLSFRCWEWRTIIFIWPISQTNLSIEDFNAGFNICDWDVSNWDCDIAVKSASPSISYV